MPFMAARDQIKLVPDTPLDGIYEKLVPLQIGASKAALNIGFGFTVTVTVKSDPLQEANDGVTEYATFIGAEVVLISVPEINDALEPACVPVIPATDGADQE
jgi:hypothetical protein